MAVCERLGAHQDADGGSSEIPNLGKHCAL